MAERNKAQIFPNPFHSVSCDVFNCYNRAKYFIGRPDGPLNLCLNLCEDCMKSVVASIPREFVEGPNAEEEGKYVCSECGESFDSRQGLAAHIRWKHGEDKK